MTHDADTGSAPASGESVAKVQAAIRVLAQHYRYLHEKRIQKLLFLAELYSLERTGKPLLGITFKRYFYGVYSEVASLALSQMEDLKPAPDMTVGGESTVVFFPEHSVQAVPLTPDEERFLGEVHEWTKNLTTEQLSIIGKTTSAWEKANFGEDLDLNALLEEPGFRTTVELEKSLLDAKKRIQAGNVLKYDTTDSLLADLGLD
ncbi:MAG: DUF4065 domain-containing protein [Euryarchaeota archaeon]|nr:DUF4065 domain-containing protein [Euryarchaeota archaeon]